MSELDQQLALWGVHANAAIVVACMLVVGCAIAYVMHVVPKLKDEEAGAAFVILFVVGVISLIVAVGCLRFALLAHYAPQQYVLEYRR